MSLLRYLKSSARQGILLSTSNDLSLRSTMILVGLVVLWFAALLVVTLSYLIRHLLLRKQRSNLQGLDLLLELSISPRPTPLARLFGFIIYLNHFAYLFLQLRFTLITRLLYTLHPILYFMNVSNTLRLTVTSFVNGYGLVRLFT